MSVQDVVKSKPQNKMSPRMAATIRFVLAQLIAIGVVVIAGWNFWDDAYAWLIQQDLKLHLPKTSYLEDLPIYTLVHIAGALISLVLGAIVLFARKGNKVHRIMGGIWMFAMVTTAVSSFFMKSFAPMLGQFGPIHVLAVWTLFSMPRGIILARKGDIKGHMQAMQGTYWGLVIAGVMTFIPGRTMFSMFFG